MSVTDDQIAHALELFEGIGPMTTRKMFGGLAIYAEGISWDRPKNTSDISDNFDTGRGGDGFWFQGRLVGSCLGHRLHKFYVAEVSVKGSLGCT